MKVVAYDKEGNAVAEEEVHTAGKPHHIELSADRNQLTADGKDLSFINVRVVDKNGNLCPDDTRQIQFKVRGAGAYRAAANGNSASLELFHRPEMKLFSGQLTAIVQTAEEPILYRKSPVFVSGGQSTQMIIGATPETDYQILNVAENLYQKFELKRVFYSAFVKVNEDKSLPALPGGPPLLREHRLYQADWLLRFYGFKAEELLDEKRPFFNVMLDPKEDWAVRHLECFPVEINRAPYADLLRVPGIGVKSARRILSARRSTKLTFQDLKKLGVVMKRAVYFITCGGRMMYPTKLEEDYIVRNLTDPKERIRFGSDGMSYRQMTLFDDGMFPNGVRQEEVLPAAVGEL